MDKLFKIISVLSLILSIPIFFVSAVIMIWLFSVEIETFFSSYLKQFIESLLIFMSSIIPFSVYMYYMQLKKKPSYSINNKKIVTFIFFDTLFIIVFLYSVYSYGLDWAQQMLIF
jgi:hypothetical protein